PGRLSVLRRLTARHPDVGLFLSPARFIDSRGRTAGMWRCPLPAGKLAPALVVERLLVQNFIACPSPLFRRAALRAGGLCDELWFTADWDLWLRLASAGPVVYH